MERSDHQLLSSTNQPEAMLSGHPAKVVVVVPGTTVVEVELGVVVVVVVELVVVVEEVVVVDDVVVVSRGFGA